VRYKCFFVAIVGKGSLNTTVKAKNASKAAEKALKTAGSDYAMYNMLEIEDE